MKKVYNLGARSLVLRPDPDAKAFHIKGIVMEIACTKMKIWPRGYKTFFVLNSAEHEILNAHKYKNIKKFGLFKARLILECYFSRSYMLKCQQLLAF